MIDGVLGVPVEVGDAQKVQRRPSKLENRLGQIWSIGLAKNPPVFFNVGGTADAQASRDRSGPWRCKRH